MGKVTLASGFHLPMYWFKVKEKPIDLEEVEKYVDVHMT